MKLYTAHGPDLRVSEEYCRFALEPKIENHRETEISSANSGEGTRPDDRPLTEAASVKVYDTSSPNKEPSRDAQVANTERKRLNRGAVCEVDK